MGGLTLIPQEEFERATGLYSESLGLYGEVGDPCTAATVLHNLATATQRRGHSGRATRLLARLLARRGDEFWPPVYFDEGLQIGAAT